MVRVAVVHGSKFNENQHGIMEIMQGISSLAEFLIMPISELKSELQKNIDGYLFIDQQSFLGLSSEFKLCFERFVSGYDNFESKVVTSVCESEMAESELRNLTTGLGAVWVGLEMKKRKSGAYEELGKKFAKVTKALKMEQLA